jgi:hypothetical protein
MTTISHRREVSIVDAETWKCTKQVLQANKHQGTTTICFDVFMEIKNVAVNDLEFFRAVNNQTFAGLTKCGVHFQFCTQQSSRIKTFSVVEKNVHPALTMK